MTLSDIEEPDETLNHILSVTEFDDNYNDHSYYYNRQRQKQQQEEEEQLLYYWK